MKFYLIVARGSKKGLPIPIDVDLFLVGSDRICQLRKQTLPPRLCAIVSRDQKVFLRDFDSGEAVLVNDQAVPPGEEWPLHAGDLIAFRNLLFMVQYREKELSRKDLEEWASTCLDVNSERNLLDEEADDFHKPTTASGAAASIIDRLTAMRGLVMGRLRIGRESGVVTVRFNDTMLVEEAEIALVRRELGDNLNRPNLRVLLDCKNVRRMSTAAVAMLRDFRSWLQPWGSSMALCRVRPEVHEILRYLHGSDIPIFPDKRAALLAQW